MNKKGFTLLELVIAISLIIIILTISVMIVDPASIFANYRNNLRTNDLQAIQNGINKYLGDPSLTSTKRSLNDLDGYTDLVTSAYGSSIGACSGGTTGTDLSSVNGAYTLVNGVAGSSQVSIKKIIDNGYISKSPGDPVSGSVYKACIDISGSTMGNPGTLVIFAPNAESVKGTLTIPFVTI